MTQNSFSSKTGLSYPTLQLLESARANPEWSTLSMLANSLGLEWKLVARKNFDWSVLIACGLPLFDASFTGKQKRNKIQPSSDLLKGAVDHLLLYIHFSSGINVLNERERESVQALLLAIASHYPKWFEKNCSAVYFKSLLSNIEFSSKVVKLKRICLEKIATYL